MPSILLLNKFRIHLYPNSEHQMNNDTYPIVQHHRVEYEVALKNHDVRILPVWESDGKGGNTLVPPEHFPSKLLPDTLVEVVISLRHHHFGNTNTFTGFMHQITIYCDPSPPLPNPFRKSCMQGPVRLSQTPSPRKGTTLPPVAFHPGRSEQIAAAQAFGPCAPPLTPTAPSTPPPFIQGSSSVKRARPPSHTPVVSDNETATTSTLVESSQLGTNPSLSPLSDIETEELASEPDVPASVAEGKRAVKKPEKSD